MDIKNLATFIQAAEMNSFTKAAQKLGYSQSTVSFQIKQLEEELNVRLFERISHTVALTEEGHELLRYAHQITRLTQELKDHMREEKDVRGHVRLAMADSLCTSMVSSGFRDFREQYPGISLKIITAETEEMFRLLNHNEVDAILTLDSHIYDAEYVIVKEEKVCTHFTAKAGTPVSRKKELRIQELIQEPFLLTEKNMSYRRLMDEKLAGMSLEIQPILETGSAELISRLVETGEGVSFLPDYVTAQKAAEGKLVYLDVPGFEVEVWKQLLYHRDKWISRQLGSVLEYFSEKGFGEEALMYSSGKDAAKCSEEFVTV